jgi:uncharacterized membrane protein
MKIKHFFSDFYNIYLLSLGFLVSLPILAPVALHLGLEKFAKAIYFIYSFFCHQFASRSINLYEYQLAWCSRDTAIWTAIFIAALLVRFNKLPKLKWYWVIPFIIPMALDGGLQTVFTFLNLSATGTLSGDPIYISNNLSRFMTGAIFGLGIGWWLAQQFKEGTSSEQVIPVPDHNSAKHNDRGSILTRYSHFLYTILITLGMFIFYVVLVQMWSITSVENRPANPLDSIVRTEDSSFFVRRGNGVCPTDDINNLFMPDCFFNN